MKDLSEMNITRDIRGIVSGGYCVGCGGCAVVSGDEGIKMQLTQYGEYVPIIAQSGSVQEASQACPFLKPDLDETILAERFLDGKRCNSIELGYYDALWAAHVVEGNWRENGSSGGVGSWLGVELLRKGLIDGVIHVKPRLREATGGALFEYVLSYTESEIAEGAHSHYHAVEMASVLQNVKNLDGRYLFIGVPCFSKSIRRLQQLDPIFSKRIPFVASLICGHMKSVNWSLSLGWGAGVSPKELAEIKFRIKGKDIASKSYFFGIRARGETDLKICEAAGIVGGKYNLGALMIPACDFCDDVVGETADITIGDAWLPEYAFDSRGKNMLIVRNKKIGNLLFDAERDGRISLTSLSEGRAVDAQAGGFRHRREGLAYRISVKRAAGEWCPEKRVFNCASPSILRRFIYRMRRDIVEQSRSAFVDALGQDSWVHYESLIRRKLHLLRAIEIASSLPRILRTQFGRWAIYGRGQ